MRLRSTFCIQLKSFGVVVSSESHDSACQWHNDCQRKRQGQQQEKQAWARLYEKHNSHRIVKKPHLRRLTIISAIAVEYRGLLQYLLGSDFWLRRCWPPWPALPQCGTTRIPSCLHTTIMSSITHRQKIVPPFTFRDSLGPDDCIVSS